MTRIALRRSGTGTALDLRADALAPRVLSTGPAGARVALVGARALLLGGDDVHLDVTVAAVCLLELVEVAGTVAYDGRGAAAAWRVSVRLGPGARLLWHGEPFVVAGGADVLRTLDADLDAGAVACLREVLVLGRSGEDGGRLRNRTRVRLEGRPLLVEDLDLREAAVRRSPAVLGGVRCLDTAALLGASPADPAGDHAHEGADVLHLERPGALHRWLGVDAHASPVPQVWRRWSGALRTGRSPLATASA